MKKENAQNPRSSNEKQKRAPLKRVAPNLFLDQSSGAYYGRTKLNGKRIVETLKVGGEIVRDRGMAGRALREWIDSLQQVRDSSDNPDFATLSDRWFDAVSHTWKGKDKGGTARFYRACIKALTPFFSGRALDISEKHCDAWKSGRRVSYSIRAGDKRERIETDKTIKPRTFVAELRTLNQIFDWAVERGLMRKNPATSIKAPKIKSKKPTTPTTAELYALVKCIRESDGREDSKQKATNAADLVELMAYSGARVSEAVSIRWRDVDFERGVLTINGEPGEDPRETGTKNGETRWIPLSIGPLRALLTRMRDEAEEQGIYSPLQFVSAAQRCRSALENAAWRLAAAPLMAKGMKLRAAYKQLRAEGFEAKAWTHHDFRHFFATTCFEQGINAPDVAALLGHKDGGALAMRVYNHTRNEHLHSVAARLSFTPQADQTRFTSLEVEQPKQQLTVATPSPKPLDKAA